MVRHLLSLILIFLYMPDCRGDEGDFNYRFLNPTPSSGIEQFGMSVSVTSDIYAIGAPNAGAAMAGITYVYSGSNRQLLQTINHPAPPSGGGGRFGNSVSAFGSNVLIGAIDAAGLGPRASGVAYLYNGPQGTKLKAFANPSPDELDLFGSAVALSATKVLVGAPEDDKWGHQVGSVFVFDYNGQRLLPDIQPPAGLGQEFGSTVAWIGEDIAVGAPGVGAVYVFDGNTHSLKNMFFTQSGDVNDRFGHAIANVEGKLLVGAPKVQLNNADGVGKAYLFDVETGELLKSFSNPSPNANDEFGFSVAGDENRVVIGSPYDDTRFTNSGAAYVMDTRTGSVVRSLVPISPLSGDMFGISVATGDAYVVGALGVGPADIDYGAAYLFQGSADFSGNGKVDGQDFLIWQRNFGSSGATFADGDADRNGTVGLSDLADWREQFSQPGVTTLITQTPEPSSVIALVVGAVVIVATRREHRIPSFASRNNCCNSSHCIR